MTGLLVGALLALALLPWALHRPGPAAGGRRPRRRLFSRAPAAPRVDVAVLLDVLDAALDAGASVPAAIHALGEALPVAQGEALTRAAAALRLGADWEQAWAQAPASLAIVARALEPAWVDGVAPGPLLRQAAGSVRASRGAAAREAAARLGVRLVLPLGLCLLPAFVLLGLVPVLISTGADLFGP